MFYLLSKLLDVFLSPLVWAGLLLAASVPWRVKPRVARRTRRRRRVYGVAGLLVLLVASSPAFANALFWSLEHAAPSTYRPDVTYDAVILLGGVVEEEPSAASGQLAFNENVERLTATYDLLRENRARVVIVSGASETAALAQYGDGVALARQLEAWGIAKERIITEDRARNTRENAVYSKAIVQQHGYERVLILTSAFHMPRAVECFAAVDMKVDTLAVDFRASPPALVTPSKFLPRAHSLAITSSVIREVFGRFVYRVQGYGKKLP